MYCAINSCSYQWQCVISTITNSHTSLLSSMTEAMSIADLITTFHSNRKNNLRHHRPS